MVQSLQMMQRVADPRLLPVTHHTAATTQPIQRYEAKNKREKKKITAWRGKYIGAKDPEGSDYIHYSDAFDEIVEDATTLDEIEAIVKAAVDNKKTVPVEDVAPPITNTPPVSEGKLEKEEVPSKPADILSFTGTKKKKKKKRNRKKKQPAMSLSQAVDKLEAERVGALPPGYWGAGMRARALPTTTTVQTDYQDFVDVPLAIMDRPQESWSETHVTYDGISDGGTEYWNIRLVDTSTPNSRHTYKFELHAHRSAGDGAVTPDVAHFKRSAGSDIGKVTINDDGHWIVLEARKRSDSVLHGWTIGADGRGTPV